MLTRRDTFRVFALCLRVPAFSSSSPSCAVGAARVAVLPVALWQLAMLQPRMAAKRSGPDPRGPGAV